MSLVPKKVKRIIEPFAGSSAITLYAAKYQCAESFIINDSYKPLINLWKRIISEPEDVARAYENLWTDQVKDPKKYYLDVRSKFNIDQDPIKFLYLVSRCVKNSIRFNSNGDFNQGSDNRRLGRRPSETRKQILSTSLLLAGKIEIHCEDFMKTLSRAQPGDLVYMDPPYQGTSVGKNPRYHQGVSVERLVEGIQYLNDRRIDFLLSYDGSCGDKVYGISLPKNLGLVKFNIHAGRSTQATLQGKDHKTIESLYTSRDFFDNSDLI